jgi:hypothetical protein
MPVLFTIDGDGDWNFHCFVEKNFDEKKSSFKV